MKAFCDVHTHNFLSKCSHDNQSTPAGYVDRAAELGLRLLGFANHCWDERVEGASSWYHDQSLAFQMQIKNNIPKDTKGVRVLVGIETEYCGMSDTLGITAEGAKENQLDFVLIPHTHVHMRNFVMPYAAEEVKKRAELAEFLRTQSPIPMEEETIEKLVDAYPRRKLITDIPPYGEFVSDFMVQSFESLMNNEEFNKLIKVVPVSVAHPFQPVGDGDLRDFMLKRIPDETFTRLFRMAAEKGVGLEINGNCNEPEMLRVLKLAREAGCRFTLGSDTHSIEVMSRIFATDPTIEALGLTEDDFMDFCR